jgi:hypothetical protein
MKKQDLIGSTLPPKTRNPYKGTAQVGKHNVHLQETPVSSTDIST